MNVITETEIRDLIQKYIEENRVREDFTVCVKNGIVKVKQETCRER